MEDLKFLSFSVVQMSFQYIPFLETIVIVCPNSFFLRKPFRPFCYLHDNCVSYYFI